MTCPVQGIQSITMQYLCMVTDENRLILGMILKSVEILYHYVVYQELTHCCRSIMLQKQTHRKRDQICGYQRRGQGRRKFREIKLDEGHQNLQTFSHEINKYYRCNVQHDKHNQHCCMLYMKIIKRVNPNSSHHKEKNFFHFFNFVSI